MRASTARARRIRYWSGFGSCTTLKIKRASCQSKHAVNYARNQWAVLYSILAGAKRHRIEPWAYLRELLMRLHADDPRIEEMLPDRWAAAHPEFVLTHRLEESRRKATAKRDRRHRRRKLSKNQPH